ncbi:MAG: acyl-CoA dehydrogenase family protein [Acidimicrobiia bacterium]|nr:acyl-CoA dehydrogenase family protein [Acidimicrobiia bacterium]
MDFELPAELAELQATVRRIARDKVKPRAREIDLEDTYPEDVFGVFAKAGLFGLVIPEDYGGSGAGILGLTLAIEEVAKYSNAAALLLLLSRLPTGPIIFAGTEEQKREYLPGIADGSQRAAFGLSEPGAGSDVMGQRTVAVRDGDEYVLTGRKCWMSGVNVADWYTVHAKLDDPNHRDHTRTVCLLVDRSLPGVEVGSLDAKMGVRGIATGELLLDEVRVPVSKRVGDEGAGFKTIMKGLNSMRPIVAARGIGLAEGALMYAAEYAKEREAFGSHLADFQGLQWMMAEVATEIEAARLLTYRSAVLSDEGRFGKEYAPYLSMAKYYATELAKKAADVAVQMLGAAGYMKDHMTELYYRDARQLTIVEGTTQVQLGLIARGLLDGDLWWD